MPEGDSCIFYSILLWVSGALLWLTETERSFKFRKKHTNHNKSAITNKISMSGKKRNKVAAKKLKRSPTIQIVAWPGSGTLRRDALWKGYYELELWKRNFPLFMLSPWACSFRLSGFLSLYVMRMDY